MCKEPPADPVCLPCSHVMCWTCAAKHIQPFTDVPEKAPRGGIPCPVCQVQLIPPHVRLTFSSAFPAEPRLLPVSAFCFPLHGVIPSHQQAARMQALDAQCLREGIPPKALALPQAFQAHANLNLSQRTQLKRPRAELSSDPAENSSKLPRAGHIGVDSAIFRSSASEDSASDDSASERSASSRNTFS